MAMPDAPSPHSSPAPAREWGPALRPIDAERKAGATRWRGVVLASAAVLAILDWTFPARGAISYAIAALLTLLVVPWAIALLSGGQSGARRGSGRVLLRAALLVLLLSFLFGKWQLLVRSGGVAPHLAESLRSHTVAVFGLFALGMLARSLRLARLLEAASDHPARLMALSFGGTGLFGAFLLSLPFSVESVERVSLVDNLFMSFSAVCVTGLSVNNLSQTYTLAGQIVLCALVQVGGLGIMVLSAAVVMLAGSRMRMKSSAVLAEMIDARSLASVRRTIFVIVVFTLAIEGAGALLLHAEFSRHPEIWQRFGGDLAGAGSPGFAAVFHAVSGFCNAGFSNFSAGLAPFVGSPLVVLTMSALIVLGGIGFPVLSELTRAAFDRLRRRRAQTLSLHSRISLRVTAVLAASMALAYFVLEWGASMKPLALGEHVLAAVFQSVSARTAGFNVVDIGKMTSATLVLTCAAMFVGACPGGTGGGIKTTTLAVLFAGLRSELLARPARLLDRTVPQPVIRRAIGVAFLSMTLVFVLFFLLLLTEVHAPLSLAFEVVSAFSTTGLSTGITPELSTAGKLMITFTMFVGRIGPLTLALALARAAQARSVALPEERVMIG